MIEPIIDPPFQIADKSLRYISPSDPSAPQGLAYHLTETWITELEKALAAVASQKPVPMRLVFEPFLTFAAKTPNKVTYKQIEANLIDPLLTALAPSPGLTDELPKSNRLKTSSGGGDLPNLLTNSCLSPQDEPLDRGQFTHHYRDLDDDDPPPVPGCRKFQRMTVLYSFRRRSLRGGATRETRLTP